jgi:hypothetical protein
MRAPARYYFSDKRYQFHNATPHARAALLDGPPRLVAEDTERVTIVVSISRDRLRAACESIRELLPFLNQYREHMPECEPYPRPAGFRRYLGGKDVRVVRVRPDPSK